MVGDAGAHQQVDSGDRIDAGDELDEFDLDAFGGDDLDPIGHRRHRLFHLGHGIESELGGEPSRAHHPQRVVGERVCGGTGGADASGDEVIESLMGVDEGLRRQTDRHRPDREVAADQIGVEVRAEGHHRFARVLFIGFGTVGRDLDLHTGLHGPDGAEFASDVPVCVDPVGDQPEDVVGVGIGGEVEVWHGATEQRVTDGTADEGEFETG